MRNPFARPNKDREKARQTARENAKTLFADGYRVRLAAGRQTADRFFADRMRELSKTELLAGYMDVFKPDQLHAPEPEPDYLIAVIQNSETTDVRYVCTCPFWKDEWYASSAIQALRSGSCKHTLGVALLVASALPISGLLRSLGQQQVADQRYSARPVSIERCLEPQIDPQPGGFALHLVGGGAVPVGGTVPHLRPNNFSTWRKGGRS